MNTRFLDRKLLSLGLDGYCIDLPVQTYGYSAHCIIIISDKTARPHVTFSNIKLMYLWRTKCQYGNLRSLSWFPVSHGQPIHVGVKCHFGTKWPSLFCHKPRSVTNWNNSAARKRPPQVPLKPFPCKSIIECIYKERTTILGLHKVVFLLSPLIFLRRCVNNGLCVRGEWVSESKFWFCKFGQLFL